MPSSDQIDQSVAQAFKPYGPDRDQLDLFGPPPDSCDPDPESVRAELLDILAQARAAPQVPWPDKKRSYWRTVFPELASSLPAEEAAQLRIAFAAELARLGAAQAPLRQGRRDAIGPRPMDG